MMLGLDHPERIDRMIVIDAPHPWPRLRPSLIPELWRSWYAAALVDAGTGPVATAPYRVRQGDSQARDGAGHFLVDERSELVCDRALGFFSG